MNKEELLEKYSETERIQGELATKILELMSETYEEKITNSKSTKELDEIQDEVLSQWPNTIGSLMMFKKIKDRKKELIQ